MSATLDVLIMAEVKKTLTLCVWMHAEERDNLNKVLFSTLSGRESQKCSVNIHN